MDANAFILAIAGTVVGGIILWFVLFPMRHFIAQRPEKKKERDRRLKLHFKELTEEAKSIASEANIGETCGAIVVYKGGVPLYHPYFVGIELPDFSESLSAHFSKDKEKWREHIGRILNHNKRYKQLLQKINNDFEAEGIPVVNIKSQLTPCIYDTIFALLFNCWKELAANRRPWPDFRKIEQVDVGDGYIHLHPEGWNASTAARVRGESDKERCERILSEVAENKEYEKEAARIIDEANKEVEDITTFKRQLTETLEDIERYWPGTRKYKFKEEKNCSRCKELFH